MAIATVSLLLIVVFFIVIIPIFARIFGEAAGRNENRTGDEEDRENRGDEKDDER